MNGQVGTLTASISVSGDLSADFTGRAYTSSGVGASIDLFPGTGFNGGRTVVSNGAVIDRGYDIVPRRQGNASDSFDLPFTVPFTFGKAIGFTVVLNAQSSCRLLGPDGQCSAQAAYASTLKWQGISLVLDSAGNPVTSFTALGSTGEDLAVPTVVPLPPAAHLASLAFAALLATRRKGRQAALS